MPAWNSIKKTKTTPSKIKDFRDTAKRDWRNFLDDVFRKFFDLDTQKRALFILLIFVFQLVDVE